MDRARAGRPGAAPAGGGAGQGRRRVEVVAETPFSATVYEFAVLGMGIGLANSLAFASGGYDRRGLVARPS